MKQNRSTMEVLAAILGLVIFVVVIMQVASYFRQGSEEFLEEQRVAGRPITLAETLSEGEAITETTTLTEGTAMTATSPVTATAATTETAAVAESAAVTTTAVTTETAAVSEAAAVTTTGEAAATTAVTTTDAATETAPVAVAAPVTTTDTVTESTEVAAAPTAEPTAEPTAAPVAAEAAAPAAGGVPAPDVMAPIFVKGTCVACHVIPNIPGAVGAVGPNLTNIGVDGATRIPGYTAEEYIHESIVNPNAFIAPECPTGACLPGIMLQNLADILTPEEIDLVVAYLAAQGK